MFIFNTTYTVHESAQTAWLKHTKTITIPDMIDDGFHSPKLMRIDHIVEPGYFNFALQFCADNKEFIERWQNEIQPEYTMEHRRIFGDKVLFFCTVMEEI